jgi:hypothetical protein
LLATRAAGTIAIVEPGVSTFRDLTMRYENRTIEPASANALSRWRASSTLLNVVASGIERQPTVFDPLDATVSELSRGVAVRRQ